MADGSLIFDTQIDSKGFNKGTASLSKQASGLKGAFASLGKVAIAAFSIKQIVKFSKEAVKLASDIQEVQNVVDTAFGDMKYKMEQFAEIALETYGISKLTAKETGSTFMAMAKGMDIANEMASEMSLQLTALSADMSSFYNKTQEVTSTALKSVFTGETETLKQFGIVMTEANLEAFRLAQGIEKSYKNMSQAEKVALRYNYVMNATKLAQGDFSKTQNSWANQTRLLSERWKELLSILGSGLVKVLTPVINALNTLLQYILELASAVSQLLGGEAKKQEEIATSIGSSVDNQNALTDATKKTAKANEKTLASFDEIQKLSANKAGPDSESSGVGGSGISFDIATPYTLEIDTTNAEVGIDRIMKMLEGLKKYLKQFEEPFSKWIKVDVSKLGGTLKNSFKTIFSGVKETVELVFGDLFSTTIPQIINTSLTAILPFFTQLFDQLIQTATIYFTVLNGLFQTIWSTGLKPAIDLLIKLWDGAWQTVYSTWQKWGEPIFNEIRKVIENVGTVLTNVWNNILQPVWQTFMDTVDWLWEKHLQPLLANFLDFTGTIADCALRIINEFILPLVNAFVEVFYPPIKVVLETIISIIGSVLGVVIDIVNGIITTLKGIIQFITGVFLGDWSLAWEGIVNAFKGIFEMVGGIVKGVINVVIDLINAMINAIETALNWIVDKVNNIKITNPFDGETIWSPSLERFEFGRIPKLATGTVVPSNNGEFLAMLGDNKRETEVVSPLSTMKQALIEALAESGQNITIRFEESSIGDLVRLLKPYIDKENRRIGNSTRVTGGAY